MGRGRIEGHLGEWKGWAGTGAWLGPEAAGASSGGNSTSRMSKPVQEQETNEINHCIAVEVVVVYAYNNRIYLQVNRKT